MGLLPGEDTFNSVTEVLLSFSLACQSCRESKGNCLKFSDRDWQLTKALPKYVR
jgi:hypothetical protein